MNSLKMPMCVHLDIEQGDDSQGVHGGVEGQKDCVCIETWDGGDGNLERDTCLPLRPSKYELPRLLLEFTDLIQTSVPQPMSYVTLGQSFNLIVSTSSSVKHRQCSFLPHSGVMSS